VPVQDAADVVARPVKTLRTWVRRGVVRGRWDDDGVLLVHWLDVRKADTERRRRVAA
jgi:hypothetical protein